MEIKAAVVFEKAQPFAIENLEISEPRENEALIRMVGAGICHTDLSVRDQFLPFPLPAVLGHEGSGIVESVGDRVTRVQPGDHVVLSWGSCGVCPLCSTGRHSYCDQYHPLNFLGTRLDGTHTLRKGSKDIHGSFFGQSSFAQFSLAHERNLVKVSNDVPLGLLGPLGCGVLTGAGVGNECLETQTRRIHRRFRQRIRWFECHSGLLFCAAAEPLLQSISIRPGLKPPGNWGQPTPFGPMNRIRWLR